MSNFCKTCIYHEKSIIYRSGETMGVCQNNEATSKIMQDEDTKITAGTVTYTSEWFGCVYWRQNNGSLININKTVKLDDDDDDI